ncbi:MAG: hypothetical protein ACLTHS_10545 [Eubacterium sp.]|nr:MAG: hypothetical protein DBY03_02030 [Clostridiales bacterium]
MQTTRHAVYGNLSHCACTICVQIIVYYVTTVTTMSVEGAKSACRVVWATLEYVTTVTTMSAEGTKSACHVVWATLEYVTTVTTMSVEGAKSACLVVWATPSPCRQKGESG